MSALVDHPRIWLQNAEDAKHRDTGRMWCEDKVWPDDSEEGEPTEYVRADLFTTLQSHLEAVKAERDDLAQRAAVIDEALTFAVHREHANKARAEDLEKALADLLESVSLVLPVGEPDSLLVKRYRAARALSSARTEEGKP